jgi:hypothetical protein
MDVQDVARAHQKGHLLRTALRGVHLLALFSAMRCQTAPPCDRDTILVNKVGSSCTLADHSFFPHHSAGPPRADFGRPGAARRKITDRDRTRCTEIFFRHPARGLTGGPIPPTDPAAKLPAKILAPTDKSDSSGRNVDEREILIHPFFTQQLAERVIRATKISGTVRAVGGSKM